MHRRLLVLAPLAVLLLTGCSTSPDAVASEIEKLEKTLVSLKDMAFVPGLENLVSGFAWMRWLALPALIGIWLVVSRWQAGHSDDHSFLGGLAQKFMLFVLIGGVSSGLIFMTFDTLGRSLWPEGLNFHEMRLALGWIIPGIEAESTESASAFAVAFGALTVISTAGAHGFAEAYLILATVIVLLTAAFNGDLRGTYRVFLAWILWAIFPRLWAILLAMAVSMILAGSDATNVAVGFSLTGMILFGLCTFVPWFVHFPENALAPAEVKPVPKTTDSATTNALIAALVGYTAGGANRGDRGTDRPSRADQAWPMDPPSYPGLPEPRTPNGGSHGGGGGGAKGQGSKDQASAAGNGNRPVQTPDGSPTSAVASALVLPAPRSARRMRPATADQPIVVDATTRSGDHSVNGHQPSYWATEDIIVFNPDGSVARVVARKGQLLFPEVIDDGLLIVDGVPLMAGQFERR